MTTEGTPGFLFRNIWSSSLVMPVQRNKQGVLLHRKKGRRICPKADAHTSCLGTQRGTKETSRAQSEGLGSPDAGSLPLPGAHKALHKVTRG